MGVTAQDMYGWEILEQRCQLGCILIRNSRANGAAHSVLVLEQRRVAADEDWGILVLDKCQILCQPIHLLTRDLCGVVARADNALRLLASRLIDVVDVVEHHVVNLTNVERVVCRTKCLAILCRSIEVNAWALRYGAVVVVVTHRVEELCRVLNVNQCFTEVADIVEVVVPIYLVGAVTQGEGINRNILLLVLLQLGTQRREEYVCKLADVIVVVCQVNVGNGYDYVAVVVNLAKRKVVALLGFGVAGKLCPNLRDNILTLGHRLIA